MKYKFELVDLTSIDDWKYKRETAQYLHQFKKIKLNKNNRYAKDLQDKIQRLRRNYKDIQKRYELRLIVPKKHQWFLADYYNYNKKAYNANDKLYLINAYKRDLNIKRSINRETKKSRDTDALDRFAGKYFLDNYCLQNRRVKFVRHKPGFWFNILKFKDLGKWKLDKSPQNNFKYIGLEIECYMDISTEEFINVLHDKAPHLIDKVTVKTDGSLYPKDEDQHAFELCILDKESDIHGTMKEVLDIAKKFGLETNNDCGVHVHLDMRNREPHSSLYNLTKFQNLMYKLTTHTRKKNRFCKPIRVIEPTTYLNKVRRSRRDNARYKGINVKSLFKHGTYEIRIHDGCIDHERLSSWIKLLVKIIDATNMPVKVPSSVKKIGALLNLDNNLLQYLEKYSKIERDKKRKVPKVDN